MKSHLCMVYICVCVLSLFSKSSYSQPITGVKLEGKVKDDVLRPLANLTVSIVRVGDTLYSRNTLSTQSGDYSFTVSPGSYYIKVSGLSYKPNRSALIETQNAGALQISGTVIHFKNLEYSDSILATIKTNQNENGEVKIKYDPTDLGIIYVYDAFWCRFVPVPAVDQEYAKGLTEWQHEVICKIYSSHKSNPY